MQIRKILIAIITGHIPTIKFHPIISTIRVIPYAEIIKLSDAPELSIPAAVPDFPYFTKMTL